MRRTDMVILVATRNGYPVYRTVYEDHGRYYINWNKKTINVDEDIANGNFRSKRSVGR